MTTLYETQQDGGIEFSSKRKAWGVDIPAYVYDLWMPLLGLDIIAILGLYYRLERENNVYGMNIKKLATKSRKSHHTISAANEILEDCGFIEVHKPEGWERLAHFTTKIITLDAPTKITAEVLEKYSPTSDKWKYEALCPWLTDSPAWLNSPSDGAEQPRDMGPDSHANIDPSSIDPSVISAVNPPIGDSPTKRVMRKSNPRRASVFSSTYVGEDKPARKHTSLESKLLKSLNKTELTDPQYDQLDKDVEGQEGDASFPSPNDLYEVDDRFRLFADDKIKSMVSNGASPSKVTKALRNYYHEHGWLASKKRQEAKFSQPNTLPEVGNIPKQQPIMGGSLPTQNQTLAERYGVVIPDYVEED